MAVVLDEHKTYSDSSGKPLAGGKLTFGIVNLDPVPNKIIIFSDRELTTAIANPVTLDANGRSLTKVWVSGKYSLRVADSANVQIYQDLDNGEESSGLTSLIISSVSGVDNIVASTGAGITSYTSDQLFQFTTAVSPNLGAVTLNVDGVGAKAVVKNHDQPLVSGDLEASQSVVVMYNATNDNFEWANKNDKVVQFSEGTPVVAASTTDIWATDGNTIHITGSTGITSFGTAPNVGARRKLVFDATPTVTHGAAAIVLPGGVNFTAAAGDIFNVYADTLTQHRVEVSRIAGTSLTSSEVSAIIDTDFSVTGAAGKFAVRAWVLLNQTGTQAIIDSENVSSIVDAGTGRTDINLTNNMPDANYPIFVGAVRQSSNAMVAGERGSATRSVSQFGIVVNVDNGTATDSTSVSVIIAG